MNTQKNLILINPIATFIFGLWLIIRFRVSEMKLLLLSLLVSLALVSCTLKLFLLIFPPSPIKNSLEDQHVYSQFCMLPQSHPM